MGELRTVETSSSSSSSSSAVDETPKQILSNFYALQEERIQTYQMFEELVLIHAQMVWIKIIHY